MTELRTLNWAEKMLQVLEVAEALAAIHLPDVLSVLEELVVPVEAVVV